MKSLPAIWETLGQEDPQEEEMTTPPIFLPGESHGQRSLAGYSPWSHKESDTTEWLTLLPTLLLLFNHVSVQIKESLSNGYNKIS